MASAWVTVCTDLLEAAKGCTNLQVIVDLGEAPASKKARALSKRRAKREFVEEAYQKSNGKWANHYMFGSREFDDLDAYRAAKAQRAARRDNKSYVYL